MRRRALLAAPLVARADDLTAIERDSGGRIGLFAEEVGGQRRLAWRANERFPMASTFKALLGGAVLERPTLLTQPFTLPSRPQMLAWSPVTETQPGGVMRGAELCAAMLEASDNTATNLLLEAVGGPAGLTAWLRRGGDAVTRLDRAEPALNEAAPGDERDTTTPAAMAATLRRLVGDGKPRAVALLQRMRGHRFGASTLRAGMPGWTLADRTGAGGHGTRGAVAHAVPPGGGQAWIIAAYLHGGPAELAARDAVMARLGALVAGVAG